MKLDVRALGTFNRLAHEGAEHAAASLGQLTTVEPRVEATSITLVAKEDVGEEFEGKEFVGVQIGLDGGLVGQSALAIDRDGARRLLESLPGDDSPELTEGRISEVGNILIGGFLDGWADYLGTAIDITPPKYVEGTGRDVVPDGSPGWEERDQVFAFTSELEASDQAVELFIYLLPETETFQELVAGPRPGNSLPVPFDKLAVFNYMTKAGAKNASDNITMMTGIDTSVEVSNLSFVPVETVTTRVDNETTVGVAIQFHGLPSGYILILFDEPSARLLVEEVVPTTVDNGEFDEMQQSAIKEIGNVMTSGFIDGWANVLDTTIDITPPKFVHDFGRSIMDPIAARIGRDQEFAFVIDSAIVTNDQQIGCNIYAVPDERELARALNSLSVDPVDIDENDQDPIPGMEVRYEDL